MIYPINESLERLMESFVDEETGELKEEWIDPATGISYELTEDIMNAVIEQLQMDFDDKIVGLRNDYINATAEVDAIAAEIKKLQKRKKAAENRSEQRKRWIAYLLKGEKFQKDACTISYRKSDEIRFDDDDPQKFVEWAKRNHPELLTQKEPEPSKTEIKKAIKAGMDVDFAHIETKNNIQIK